MFTILGGDGKEYGPVTAGKLHEWIAAGRANLKTKVRREGETEWKALGDIPELSQFGTTGGSTPPALPELPAVPYAPATPIAASPTSSFRAVSSVSSLELEPAGRWLRLGAYLLDSLIICILIIPGFCLIAAAGVLTHDNEPNAPMMVAGFGVMGLAVLIAVGIQIYLLTTRGQTMGKKLLGIKIVSFDDESNPGFVKAFLLRSFVNGLICFVPAYRLVDTLFIFRDDRRCIHDLLAGTKVVKA